MKLTHAISPSMFVGTDKGVRLDIVGVSRDRVIELLDMHGLDSRVGHRGLAQVLTNELEMSVHCTRRRLGLAEGEQFIMAHYQGPPLEEDDAELPEDAVLRFYHIQVVQIRTIFATNMPPMGDASLEEQDQFDLAGERHD